VISKAKTPVGRIRAKKTLRKTEKERKKQPQSPGISISRQKWNSGWSVKPPGAVGDVVIGPSANGGRGDAWRVPLRVDHRGPARSGGLGVLGGLAHVPVPSAQHRDERLVGRAVFGTACRW
jgi:hypothetical protein